MTRHDDPGSVRLATTAGQDRPGLRQAIQDAVDSGFAGVQLRVHDEHGEWVGSAGVARLGEPGEPPTDGHFRIGSNTKTFAATLVLQLVADGMIELDEPAADYLRGLELDRRITVRMLLQHTSGVFNFTGEYYPDGTIVPGITWSGQEWVDQRFRTYQPRELVQLALSQPGRFEPGTDWSYSNTNYVLARLLIEEVTGTPFPEQMRRRILRPLGLTGTLCPEASPEIPEPHAHGYYTYEHEGEWRTVDVTQMNPSWCSTGGDMISTTQDLRLFITGLLGGKLLPEPLLTEMCTPRETPVPDMGYGLGVFVRNAGPGGQPVITHNGGFSGWASLMYSTPDRGRTLTGSLTLGDARLDFAGMAEIFQNAQRRLVEEVFDAPGW